MKIFLVVIALASCVAVGAFLARHFKKSPAPFNESQEEQAAHSPFADIDRQFVGTENRAYEGAPPTIPHPIENDMNALGKDCLACHLSGGFVPKFKASAPITPHPQLENCRQCHVPKNDLGAFKKSQWLPLKKKHVPPRLLPTPVEKSMAVSETKLDFKVAGRIGEMKYFPCASCHDQRFSETIFDPKKRVAHFDIKESHPQELGGKCVTCHDPKNYGQLHTIQGKPIQFDESYRVCAQCHQGEYKDFRMGIHGKRIKNWQGDRVVMNCTSCHNPHSPKHKMRAPAIKRKKGGKNG